MPVPFPFWREYRPPAGRLSIDWQSAAGGTNANSKYARLFHLTQTLATGPQETTYFGEAWTRRSRRIHELLINGGCCLARDSRESKDATIQKFQKYHRR